jgi:hypothetical protein
MACTKQTTSKMNGGMALNVTILNHRNLKFKIKILPKVLRTHLYSSVVSAEMVLLAVMQYMLVTVVPTLCALSALTSQTCMYQNWGKWM